jgi:hypothetical protein
MTTWPVPNLTALAKSEFADLTDAELRILASAAREKSSENEYAAAGSKPDGLEKNQFVRGELIRWLCTRVKEFVDPSGLLIWYARIIGEIDLAHTSVPWPLAFGGCLFDKILEVQGAQLRTLSLYDCSLHSVLADGAVLDGAFFLRKCIVNGGVQFTGARVLGQFDCSGSTIEGLLPGGNYSLVLDSLETQGIFLREGFLACHSSRAIRAQITTDLDCRGASFHASKDSGGKYAEPALDVSGVTTKGSVFLSRGFHADGMVTILGGQIGVNFDCSGAKFSNTSGALRYSLVADLVDVSGTILLASGLEATCLIRLISARVGSDLRCTGAKFDQGLALERATINGTFYWRDITIDKHTRLNLMDSRADSLADETSSWPCSGNLFVQGFEYRRIAEGAPRSASERLRWLSLANRMAKQPYQQLAKVLVEDADPSGSRKVLHSMESRERKLNRSLRGRFVSTIFEATVGYGYYPHRAFLWLLLIVAIGFFPYREAFHKQAIIPSTPEAYTAFISSGETPPYFDNFHASLYSFENSFPFVNFGQAAHWHPTANPTYVCAGGGFSCWLVEPHRLEWLRAGQIVLGWFLATIGLAAVTGLIRKS